MTYSFHQHLAYALILSLSACSFVGKTEIDALKQTAIQDAQKAPKVLKLDYIKCYALEHPAKEQCYQILSKYSEKRRKAQSWLYIKPFEEEMELAGFAVFLNNHGKQCSYLAQKPESISTNTYRLNCMGGKSYNITFIREKLSWVVG